MRCFCSCCFSCLPEETPKTSSKESLIRRPTGRRVTGATRVSDGSRGTPTTRSVGGARERQRTQ